ncbi:MAG: hypothetical protein A2070_14535, partial [Bdellovibrionales bacterium GWC1_52_8]
MVSEKKEFSDLRLLLVDDDLDFRNVVQMVLEKNGFNVTTADNGKLAAQIFGLGEFDIVISDIRMPEMNGIQLTHFIKAQNKTTPVILVTGFSEISETEEAYQLGANAFIPKPFKREDLLEALRKCLNTTPPPRATESFDLDYCRISLDEFISGRRIQYNIFVRLSEANYIKIAHMGEDLTPDRIATYKRRNVRFLYLKKEDFKKYITFNVGLAPLVRTASSLPKDKKIGFFKQANEILLTEFSLKEIPDEAYQDATIIVGNTLSLATDDDDIFKMISSMGGKGDPLFTHALAVNLYSVLIAKECGWTSPLTLTKVGMAGLFHDIGLREINKEILDKDREDMTPEELRLYESHPARGLELLAKIRSIPEDIARVAYQHHEDCTGMGYPQRLSRARIDPMARLVAVADQYCTLVWGRMGETR